MTATTNLLLAFAICLSFHSPTIAVAQDLPVVFAKRDIPAETVLSLSDLKISKMEALSIPGNSFAEIDELIGQKSTRKIFANSPILKSQVVRTADAPPSVTPSVVADSPKIIAIPVGIATRYEVGELVRLVDTIGDQRKTIADNLKVFHIGEPDTIDGEDNKKIFIRFVSVLAPIQTVATISNALDSGNGIYVLEKVDPNARPQPSVASTRPRLPRSRPTLPKPAERTVAPNPETYPGQLRQMARLLETQAAELEEKGSYEQADLIRAACQKLREAARVK